MKNSQMIHKFFIALYLIGLIVYLFFYAQGVYGTVSGNLSFPLFELSPMFIIFLLIYIHYKLLRYNFSSRLQSTFFRFSYLSLALFVISGGHALITQPREWAGIPDMIGLILSGIFWVVSAIAGLGALWNRPKI